MGSPILSESEARVLQLLVGYQQTKKGIGATVGDSVAIAMSTLRSLVRVGVAGEHLPEDERVGLAETNRDTNGMIQHFVGMGLLTRSIDRDAEYYIIGNAGSGWLAQRGLEPITPEWADPWEAVKALWESSIRMQQQAEDLELRNMLARLPRLIFEVLYENLDRPVSLESIGSECWPDPNDPPMKSTIHRQISRLRRAVIDRFEIVVSQNGFVTMRRKAPRS